MSEIYTVVCSNVAVSASQDVLGIYSGASTKVRLLSAELAANGQVTVGNLAIRIRAFDSGTTPGSGGTTPTPRNVNPDGPGAGSTAHANDTTQASGAGRMLVSSQFNPINGYYWQAPRDDAALKIDLNGILVLSLDGTPGGPINVSATLTFEEI